MLSDFFDRVPLMLASVRNIVLRSASQTGLPMPSVYTANQIAIAHALYQKYRSRYDLLTSAALLGCNEGECSFVLTARGDHGEAGGVAQWHNARRQLIFKNTGIDVWKAGSTDQAAALMAEISGPWSAYRHVEKALIDAQDLRSKMTILVSKFEQSGSQARDILRRTALAEAWLQYAKDHWNEKPPSSPVA